VERILRLYVINLDRSSDRLVHATKVFTDLGLEFTRIAAVDGNELDEVEYQWLTRDHTWPIPLTRPEVGCFLSHRKFLQIVVDQDEPYAAVFEDDVNLSPHAIKILKNHAWIKPGIDIIKLDTAKIKCWLEPLYESDIKPYRLGRLLSKHYGGGGYIVSREAAIRLLAVTQQAFAPIDEIYFNPYCCILQSLNVQQIVPAPVVHTEPLASTIREPFDASKRQRTKKRLPRTLLDSLKREMQRFYRRRLRPIPIIFWYKWIRGYYWGKIPFG